MAQINKPTNYFNTVLYTGNGSTQSITGVGFQPDWIWFKVRSEVGSHRLVDSVRGNTKYLFSNGTDAEATVTTNVTSFDSDGFSLGNGSVNENTRTYASWNWLADNTSGSSNTDGSITSTVSANTISGFSIGTYTGTGASATIGHGLGTSPSMVIIKRTDSVENWRVHHVGLTGLTYRVALDTNQAEYDETTSGLQSWNSSTFTLGSGGSYNASGGSFVFYAFAEKKGFSNFGRYTGNGSTDGPFIYTGFKPAFVILKDYSQLSGWEMADNKRTSSGGNVIDKELRPHDTTAETTNNYIDFLSNGFKLRNGFGNWNGSGASYLYMAFAESPLVGTNNIPATAR